MAIDVIIEGKELSQYMDIVRELRASGLNQGEHFDFKYIPSVYDYEKYRITPKKVIFTFYDEQYSTLFRLKYES